VAANVAITGASGFVGRHLVRMHLARGDLVRVLARQPHAAQELGPVKVVLCDLARPEVDALECFCDGADVLYHCAAEIRDERRMGTTNVQGTRVLAQLAAGRIGRWVQLSSAAVYGAVRSGTIVEDSPIRPDSLYGKTKSESENIVSSAAADGDYETTIVRPSNIFSAGMPSTSLFRLFEVLNKGMFFFIGEPQATMNYVHLENVASALVQCGTLNAAAGRTYNVSDQMSIERFIAIVADEIEVRCPTLRLPEPPLRVLAGTLGKLPGIPLTHRNLDALTMHAWYDSNRIRRELSYSSVVSLEAGLRGLAREWKRSH
jgi:nucleoside-diphosphate-sugar epimerase